MTSIQRYDAWPQEWPFEAEDGDLVTYEDHRKIVEELEAKLEKAMEGLTRLSHHDSTYVRDIASAYITELSSVSCANLKGQNNDH